ncbi:MAG: hypothetical protein JWQ56_2130 [Pseudarthrobacter sp.]|nr:hypothetical protein [Pseudarthrobacter sp.]
MMLSRKALLPVLAGLVAVLLSASAPPVVTDAAWQDPDVARGSFAAATIPAPTLNGQCSYNSSLFGPDYIRILWKAPAGYSKEDAELQLSTTGLGAVLAPVTGYSVTASTTGTAAGGYITDVEVSVVDNLIGLLSRFRLAIVMKRYGWTSQAASVRANAGIALGRVANCTNETAAG